MASREEKRERAQKKAEAILLLILFGGSLHPQLCDHNDGRFLSTMEWNGHFTHSFVTMNFSHASMIKFLQYL